MRVLLHLLLAQNLLAADSFPGGRPQTPVSELPRLSALLRDGNWNDRIHAVHRLGAMGPAAQNALAGALQDADWQVRFTAVHWLGRQGQPSIPALDRALREDPCRLIRLNAVHWLGSLGPRARASLEAALLDESGMVRMTNRYWIRKIEGNDRAAQPETNPGEELSACTRSELPLRLTEAPSPRFSIPAAAGRTRASAAPPEQPLSPEAAVAKAALAKRQSQNRAPENAAEEIDRLFGAPETLDAPQGPAARAAAAAGDARREDLNREIPQYSPPKSADLPLGLKESLEAPRGPSVPEESAVSARPEIFEFEPHAPRHDPLPQLLDSLEDKAPRMRARAADELGRLGAKAGPAVGALMIAMRDESPRVRASAALALGNIGAAAEGALTQLKRALKDSSADVRYSAAVALGRIGTPAAEDAFAHYLKNEAKDSIDAD